MQNLFKLTITDTAPMTALLPDPNDHSLEVWHDLDGRVCAYGHSSTSEHWMHLPGLASFCFNDTEPEVKAIAHSPTRIDLIEDAYHRSVLPMAMQALGTEVLHASAFVANNAIIALCANSGTGKSTLACGMRRRGYRLWADDAVAFEHFGRGVLSIPLRFCLRLLPESVAYFKRRGQYFTAQLQESNAARKRAPLHAVVLLKRKQTADDAIVETVRLAPSEAFVKVLAHAYCFSLADLSRKRLMMNSYFKLVTTVPVYEITFRSGLENLPYLLDCLERLALEVSAENELRCQS